MLCRTIFSSVPSSSVMTFSATCEFGRLHVVVQLDVVELGAADHPLLLLDRQRVPRSPCRARTSARARSSRRRSRDPRRRSGWRCRASGPSGFSVPSTKPSRSRLSKNRKPCTSSTTVIAPPSPSTSLAGQLEADVHRLGADVEQQIARGGRRVVPRAVELDERVQFGRAAGRRTAGPTRPSRSTSPPTAAWPGSRKPIARTNPEMSASASWTVCSPPSSMVATRKMAAGVNGARTGCGSGCGHRTTLASSSARSPTKMVTMSASPQGLCEFIDASPSPFHVCVTAARAAARRGVHRALRDVMRGRRERAITSPCGPVR